MNCEALLFDPDIDEGGLIARAGDCFAPRKYCVKFYPKNRTESLHGFLHDISLKQLPTVEVVIKALDDESSSGECRFTLETEEGVWSTISHFTIHVYDEFRNKGVGTDLILCMHFIINSIDRNLVKMTHSEINPEDESYFSRLLAFYRRSLSNLLPRRIKGHATFRSIRSSDRLSDGRLAPNPGVVVNDLLARSEQCVLRLLQRVCRRRFHFPVEQISKIQQALFWHGAVGGEICCRGNDSFGGTEEHFMASRAEAHGLAVHARTRHRLPGVHGIVAHDTVVL